MQASNAVLRFKNEGVTHVIVVTDVLAWIAFSNQAESQGYRPVYGFGDYQLMIGNAQAFNQNGQASSSYAVTSLYGDMRSGTQHPLLLVLRALLPLARCGQGGRQRVRAGSLGPAATTTYGLPVQQDARHQVRSRHLRRGAYLPRRHLLKGSWMPVLAPGARGLLPLSERLSPDPKALRHEDLSMPHASTAAPVPGFLESAAARAGAACIGWQPSLDFGAGRKPDPVSPDETSCLAIIKESGQQTTGATRAFPLDLQILFLAAGGGGRRRRRT